MTIDISKIGVVGATSNFEVTKERIIAYALATNDEISDHLEGQYASPVFAVAPMWEALMGAVTNMVDDADIFSIVHGEQDMFFYSKILPGDKLVSEVTPIGLVVKPSGSILNLLTTTSTESGELRNKQVVSFFFRGISEGESSGEPAPKHRFTSAHRKMTNLGEVSSDLKADQTFLYSKASGDDMPIHLDDDFAKSVGLPGIIIHGLCTMAISSSAVLKTVANLKDYEGLELSRLAVRFSRFVLPGETITTVSYDNDEPNDQHAAITNYLETPEAKKTVVFETQNADEQTVLKDGRAEFVGKG
jgi:acyl dehydratase